MRKWLWVAVGLLLCGALLGAPAARPAPAKAAATESKAPGVEAAQALSTLTGVAISPLLGVGAVGAWKYWRTPAESRDGLPWFARPWFWGPALFLVALVFLKDTLGATAPRALKKPLDLAELFENKLSALIAAGLFVPVVASIFHSAGGSGELGAWGLAVIDMAPLGNLLVLPLALVVFVVVFLAGHAINVLVLISPFRAVDTALKSFRLLLVGSVAATSLANPYLGAVWALVLVIVSYFIAGWSLRLTVFGSVLAWDLASWGHRRFRPDPAGNWAFTARRLEKVPVRTYGRLVRDAEGRLWLHYRPWLVLPRRTLGLPPGPRFVGRGVFYPEIRRMETDGSRVDLVMPPRCRTHEEELARLYGLGAVQDIGLRRGLKAAWAWLKGLFGWRTEPPVIVALPAEVR